jgi:hypothetical protein
MGRDLLHGNFSRVFGHWKSARDLNHEAGAAQQLFAAIT